MTPELCRKYVEDQRREKLTHYASGIQALKDLTDFRNADDKTSQDYAGRFAFELMQNGSDAHAEGHDINPEKYPEAKGRICFILSENCLVVANTGVPFSHGPRDGQENSSLESISRYGESTKTYGKFIGNKGIGFKSIYQICNRLWLISGGYQVRYDGEVTRNALIERFQGKNGKDAEACLAYLDAYRGRIPMLKVGAWFELNELEGLKQGLEAAVREVMKDGYDTILILERKAGADFALPVAQEFIRDKLSALSKNEILFLDTLSEVHCRDLLSPEWDFAYIFDRDVEESKRIVLKQYPKQGKSEIWEYLIFELDMPEIDGQQARIAFQLENNRPVPADVADRVFYTFYPASREAHGFPFFIHSYFDLSPNRENFNLESDDSILWNRQLLDDLAVRIAGTVIPDLQKRFPDLFLPEVLFPSVNKSFLRIMEEMKKSSEPEKMLSGVGGLTARFILRMFEQINQTPLLKDLKGRLLQLNRICGCSDAISAQAADVVLASFSGLRDKSGLPDGLISEKMNLLECMDGLREYFPMRSLDPELVADALRCAGQAIRFSEKQAAALVVLLKNLAGKDTGRMAGAVAVIQQAKVPVLPCRGENNVQPLPKMPEKGTPMRATAGSPLIFYAPSSGERESGETADEEESADKMDIPEFCHVHVLKNEVFSAFTDTDPEQIRTILKENMGLRPFRPGDIFVRIAESTLSIPDAENPLPKNTDYAEQFLKATLRLVQKRLSKVIREKSDSFQPWFLKNRNDSDWRFFYYLAQSFIPAQGPDAVQWVRGSQVILAGRFASVKGIERLYEGTPQVFLSEKNEAEWLMKALDAIYDLYTDDYKQEAGEDRRIHFRAYVYRLLGAWDSPRLELISHPEGRDSDRAHPDQNPHSCLTNDQWTDYIVNKSKSPWKISLTQCRLIESAAIPHLDHMEGRPDLLPEIVSHFERIVRELSEWSKVHVVTTGGQYGSYEKILSFLYWQLRNFPWIPADWKQDAPADSPIWFTQQEIRKPNDRLGLYYLRAVSAGKMSEGLARAAGLPVLEDATRENLDRLVALYRQLCDRICMPDDVGSGFLTLYRAIVVQIRKILLGNRHADRDPIEKIKEAEKDHLETIRKAGVICLAANKGHRGYLEKDLVKVCYDDSGTNTLMFRNMLNLAAFDENSLNMAELLDIKLLSNMPIEYVDGHNLLFEGNEETEEKIETMLREIGPFLFAFRAFAAFIPEAQRLTVGEDNFERLWRIYNSLKVAVVETLRIRIDFGEPQEIDGRLYKVVLEHENKKETRRRLFIRKTCLGGMEQIPAAHDLARPIASLIGAEAQTVAVEMLLRRYQEDGISAVRTYLEDHCGITVSQIGEIADADEKRKQERRQEIASLLQKALSALSTACPEKTLSEDQKDELEKRISENLSLSAVPVLAYIQDTIDIPLYLLRDSLNLSPFPENIDRFKNSKGAFRMKTLTAAAMKLGITVPNSQWDDIKSEYDGLRLSMETAYRFRPSEADLSAPVKQWMAGRGIELSETGGHALTGEERDLWEKLNPEPEDPGRLREMVGVFIPWAIALSKKYSSLPVGDLLDALDEKDLHQALGLDGGGEIAREKLEAFLKRRSVPAAQVGALFADWPEFPKNTDDLEVTRDKVNEVRSRIEAYRNEQYTQSRSQGLRYRRLIRDMIREKPALAYPEEKILVGKTVGKPEEQVQVAASTDSEPKASATPRRIKRRAVSESDYVVADFQNRVVGQCAEHFALEVQKLRWEELIQKTPERFAGLLADVKSYYDLDDADAERLAVWTDMESLDPAAWNSGDHWETLQRLIYMAEWSPNAGYDILGLDWEEDENWRIYRIEVKGTLVKNRLDFPISKGELKEAETNGETYVIWRIVNVTQDRRREPSFFRLPDPVRLINEGKLSTEADVVVLRPNVR